MKLTLFVKEISVIKWNEVNHVSHWLPAQSKITSFKLLEYLQKGFDKMSGTSNLHVLCANLYLWAWGKVTAVHTTTSSFYY